MEKPFGELAGRGGCQPRGQGGGVRVCVLGGRGSELPHLNPPTPPSPPFQQPPPHELPPLQNPPLQCRPRS
eukprot:198851-Chlamydomonas_euryale.AAC.1